MAGRGNKKKTSVTENQTHRPIEPARPAIDAAFAFECSSNLLLIGISIFFITRKLLKILMEHIETKNSLYSQLRVDCLYSIKIRSRK